MYGKGVTQKVGLFYHYIAFHIGVILSCQKEIISFENFKIIYK